MSESPEMQEMRKQFEDFMRDNYGYKSSDLNCSMAGIYDEWKLQCTWRIWQDASAPVDLEMCLNAADKDIYYQRIKEAIKAVTDELIRQSVRMGVKS